MPRQRLPLIAASFTAAVVIAACGEGKAAEDSTKISPPPQSTAVPAVDSPPSFPTATAQDSAILRALTLEVHKEATCGCCAKWVDHMKAYGFKVVVTDHPDIDPVKKKMGVPDSLGSCHTAKIGTYLVEGHIPAEDVMRLLREKPEVIGIAAPGMPVGSPGMEASVTQPYDVVAWTASGTKVFAQRGRN